MGPAGETREPWATRRNNCRYPYRHRCGHRGCLRHLLLFCSIVQVLGALTVESLGDDVKYTEVRLVLGAASSTCIAARAGCRCWVGYVGWIPCTLHQGRHDSAP